MHDHPHQTHEAISDSAELIPLPHSGLRVPHTRLTVTGYRELAIGACGITFTATLLLDRHSVGTVFNEGLGGPTGYQPHTNLFTDRDLAAFTATCRTAAGRIPDQETVLEALVTEARTSRRIARAARRGQTPLRLVTSLHDDGTDPIPVGHATAALITTNQQRQRLAAELADTDPPQPGEWWQLWTGTTWQNLPPHGDHPAGANQAGAQ